MRRSFYKLIIYFSVVLSISVFSRSMLHAQCMMVPVSLQERTEKSSTIVLGKLIDQQCYFNADHTGIYTLNIIEVSAILKGTQSVKKVAVISEGGTVDNVAQITFPSLQLDYNNEYVLFLGSDNNKIDNRSYRSIHPEIIQAEAYASSQGAITKQFGLYHDLYSEPTSVESDLFNKIKNITKQEIRDPDGNIFIPRDDVQQMNKMEMSITSFSPSPSNAGTIVAADYLNISGSSFGAAAGTVYYSNADDGGATFVSSGVASDNTAWSTTAITNKIARAAGTGPINVNGTMTSASSLTVNYAHLNVNSSFSGFGSTTRQRYYLRNLNGSGGYTFVYNSTSGFSTNTSAIDAFERALETWRCAIYVNFSAGGTTTNVYAFDGVNTVVFDGSLPVGVLARATSWFNGASTGGCSGTNTVWYMSEVDVQVMPDPPYPGYTWQYGPSSPSATQFDMESVLLHELGHAIGLGHTIAPTETMHYAISNGATKRTVSANEIAGGNAKMAYSTVATCFNPTGSGTPMVALTAGSCILLPISLITFTGNYIDELHENVLNWTTATELDNDYFTLEKSVDGISFFAIGIVDAAGNSNNLSNYDFYDHAPVPGINYYRLRQTDINGNYTYSTILPIMSPLGSPSVSVYPNPASTLLTILFDGTTSTENNVKISDINGRMMYSGIISSDAEHHAVQIDVSNFSRGLYMVEVENEFGRETTGIVKN